MESTRQIYLSMTALLLLLLVGLILGWPKSSLGFFCMVSWKNPNELLSNPIAGFWFYFPHFNIVGPFIHS